MPFEPHEYVQPWDVVWFWGCVALPEQLAATALVTFSLLGVAVAPADPIDLIFVAASPGWWERRVLAWRGGWQVGEEEIEIDGVPVRVYTCLAGWVGALFECPLIDGCAPGYSVCPSRPSYSSPFG